MPFTYTIDHEQRLVLVRGHGTLNPEDFFQYQTEAWSHPDVQGYDELVDMNEVEAMVQPSSDKMRDLARLSARMDIPTSGGKLAIVAPEDLAFGLGRMYEAFRALNPQSTKQVCVFRTLPEAQLWLADQEQAPSAEATNSEETG